MKHLNIFNFQGSPKAVKLLGSYRINPTSHVISHSVGPTEGGGAQRPPPDTNKGAKIGRIFLRIDRVMKFLDIFYTKSCSITIS